MVRSSIGGGLLSSGIEGPRPEGTTLGRHLREVSATRDVVPTLDPEVVDPRVVDPALLGGPETLSIVGVRARGVEVDQGESGQIDLSIADPLALLVGLVAVHFMFGLLGCLRPSSHPQRTRVAASTALLVANDLLIPLAGRVYCDGVIVPQRSTAALAVPWQSS